MRADPQPENVFSENHYCTLEKGWHQIRVFSYTNSPHFPLSRPLLLFVSAFVHSSFTFMKGFGHLFLLVSPHGRHQNH